MESVLDDCLAQFSSKYVLKEEQRQAVLGLLEQKDVVGVRGGYSWDFLVEVCRPVLQILTLFQTKKCHFLHPFSDLACRQKLCHHYLD